MKLSVRIHHIVPRLACLGLAALALDASAQIIVRRAAPVVVVEQPAVVVAPAPVMMAQPGAVVGAPGMAYVATPLDTVLVETAPAPADVVFVGGDTYVWVRDPYGHRERRFYRHGDFRHEAMERHAMLDRMRRENGGRLPEPGMHRDAQGHWAHPGERPGANGAPHPGEAARGTPGEGTHPTAAPKQAVAAAPHAAPATKKK